jgi:hypothetical protein
VVTLAKDRGRARRLWVATAASFVWLGLWILVPHLLGTWVVLFLVYAFVLGGFGLAEGSGIIQNGGLSAWRAEFLRTADWFVLSGFLALAYGALYLLARAWFWGEEIFPQ